MTTYLKFTEVNEHEGETWHHYLPIEGNEATLEQLRDYLAKAKTECQWDFPYTLGTEPIAESEVDTLVKHSDVGYMMQHNKVVGVLKEFDVDADPDDLFYKGEIDKLFVGVARREGRPVVTAEMNVPDEAIAAGWHEFRYPRPAVDEPSAAFLRGLRAAAPLIVAAELERIAGVEGGVIAEMTERRDERETVLDNAGVDPESDPTYAALSGVVHARSAIVRKIRERVAELRGESR